MIIRNTKDFPYLLGCLDRQRKKNFVNVIVFQVTLHIMNIFKDLGLSYFKIIVQNIAAKTICIWLILLALHLREGLLFWYHFIDIYEDYMFHPSRRTPYSIDYTYNHKVCSSTGYWKPNRKSNNSISELPR